MATKWFHKSIAYQIWPASFRDSNGDGVGDIEGIISKLSYLKETLSIDMLWLSPIYDSPQKDMGYDVSDYESIYHKYGTLDDFARLVRECKDRGIRVVMDLVVNHTSDQHKWFLESKRNRAGKYADFYHWRCPKYDAEGKRHPPNNWRTGSRYGKSCWTYVDERDQYYFHFGAPHQPNLNWSTHETREEIYESAAAFWLRRGVDGFRMDLVGFYWKDSNFPDAKVVYPDERLQPLDGQYCHNGSDVHVWLKEWRRKVHQDFGQDIVLIGELPGTGRDEFLRFIAPGTEELDMALDTDIFITGNNWVDALYELKKPELPLLKDAVLKTQSMLDEGAWPTVFLENHDFARSVSRFGPGDGPHRDDAAKMLALMACTLSGTLFIYQGQEIGMTNVPPHWRKSEFRDNADLDNIEDIDEKKAPGLREKSEKALVTWGRDNGRTLMQWSGETHAGFSEGEPWIGVNDNYQEVNVTNQIDRQDSVLAFWKHLVRVRKDYWEFLGRGRFQLLDRDEQQTMSYIKTNDEKTEQLLVVLNFSADEASVSIDGDRFKLLISTCASAEEEPEGVVKLQPWEGRLYQGAPPDESKAGGRLQV
ncbi:Alpha-glucosidase [Fulvia fulva]|uniref:Alpha-glucosidase n=1 Tax=Passalora fulva TaxID=5499 RepID=A0A9Q8PEY9_PASFU|nr:Alpha-glucosidase [Fulvia fulva]KAK4618204.1 Alpha-glucosidase [Fulvia fulva]KAK4618644.1 Alpha-glucosidase [Fulvia fulva]UJO21200.1 Alpha-glucosidase [Fulvia fulva]WPV17821.1 Alpha-glucosidase [Fulvia fulva]WPV33369.1 Alpha-glucosidase [Fulvia fulva]